MPARIPPIYRILMSTVGFSCRLYTTATIAARITVSIKAFIKKIELEDISESFPAFITMITMVLCYSIADGICLGILSYVLIKMMVGKFKDLNPTLYILSIFLLFNYVFG